MVCQPLRRTLPLFLIALLAPIVTPLQSAEPPEPKPKPPVRDDKPRGPEHSVTLMEDPKVQDLLARAKKFRDKAEKEDKQAWPECVKSYAEILKNYSHTVYLDRWEGPDRKVEDMGFKNGLYKSTRERVVADIASLPPAGLAIYRMNNDPEARKLYVAALADFDERKMETVAQTYFSTSLGDDALAWLGEAAFDRGAPRQTLARLQQALKHPDPNISKTAAAARMVLARIELHDRAGAEDGLKQVEDLLKDHENGTLRLGHLEGTAALDKLRARVAGVAGPASVPAGEARPTAESGRAWPAYFGNATHTLTPPTRATIGLRKWSVAIRRLLYGPGAEIGSNEKVQLPDGNVSPPVQTMNYHLTLHGGFFYLCRDRGDYSYEFPKIVAYPIGNPKEGQFSDQGNARFAYPSDVQAAPKQSKNEQQARMMMRRTGRVMGAQRHHPFSCTIGDGRLFAVLGPDVSPFDPDGNFRFGGGGGEIKQAPNYLVALGRGRGEGTPDSGKLVWSLNPSKPNASAQEANPAFDQQSAADQAWLRTVYFTGAPTYENGVLYISAVLVNAGQDDAFAAAFDAESGRLLWRTQICSANPLYVGGPVQPDVGLPVAVHSGTVYVVTNLGAVAALDAASGGVKWIRVYDRVMTGMERFNRGNMRSDFWGPNPPIVYGNVLLCTPQDSDFLYAYDLETGKRLWEAERAIKEQSGNESDQLKHILGIANGHLVLSGSGLHFREIKSGKKSGPVEPLPLESPIKGRGLVTANVVLVPTEKALIAVDVSVGPAGTESGPTAKSFKPRILNKQPWTEPEVEAGNIFVAGDVLYTVSATHVNAYFVWEEMERKLKERIQADAGDLAAYSELADVYHKVEKFDLALEVLDRGLARAGKAEPASVPAGRDAGPAAASVEMRRRKFDALMELGNQESRTPKGPSAARTNFTQALEVALTPGLPDVLPVIALRALAENALLREDAATAADHYQQIIEQHGNAVYAYAPGASSSARLFAQSRLNELKQKSPAAYQRIEERAKAALDKAGLNIPQLEELLARYPNSSSSGAALLRLAQAALEKNPDQARLSAQSFLNRYPLSEDAPAALALLAVASERSRLLGPARALLVRLAERPQFAGKTIAFDPTKVGPASLPAGTEAGPTKAINVAEWARKRLQEPQFLKTPTSSVLSLGDGKLKPGWGPKAVGEQSFALAFDGVPPAHARRTLFYIENQAELSAISGTTGEELWTPRPKTPDRCLTRALWAGHLLVLCGQREIAAYDSTRHGALVWKHELAVPNTPPAPNDPRRVRVVRRVDSPEQPELPSTQCWLEFSFGRLVIGYPTGALSVLDAASGKEMWQTKGKGAQFVGAPVCGDGFVAAGTSNPGRLAIYELETGTERAVVELATEFALPPQAEGDSVYFANRNNFLNAVDAFGKPLWQFKLEGPATMLVVSRELVAVVVAGNKIVAIPTGGQGERKHWSPVLNAGATVRDLHIDGEELFVVVGESNKNELTLCKYSIPLQGKFEWPLPMAAEAFSAAVDENSLSTGHVLVTQKIWHVNEPTAFVLADRRTGKRTWTANLGGEQRQFNDDGTPRVTCLAQLFDGGVVVTDNRKRSGYLATDAVSSEEEVSALQRQAAASPNDLGLRAKVAVRAFERGDLPAREKALAELAAILAAKGLPAAGFAEVYGDLARLRQELAKTSKRGVAFKKVAADAKMDAEGAGWGAVPETVFDSWRDLYLPGDGSSAAKGGQWQGPADLKVSFKGAYDEKNLYIRVAATDDKHVNDAADAMESDLGDSLKLVFDIDRDGGRGFRGKDFEITAALAKGTVLSRRWWENGKFLAGDAPLQTAPVILRKEAEKQTVYLVTLPLEYLTIKPELGASFGFSFVVNDRDDAGDKSAVNKSMGASPGATRPPYPSLFAEGKLE